MSSWRDLSSTPRALETIGSWYWVVDEIEARGLRPRLVHARKAKVMMGMVDKSDKLDARGLNTGRLWELLADTLLRQPIGS